MGKRKKKKNKEVVDNTTAPYYEGFVDGYNEGYAACTEEDHNNTEAQRGIRCDFCANLEEGDYLYELEQEGDSLNFCGYKVWFCPICGAKLGHGFLEEA